MWPTTFLPLLDRVAGGHADAWADFAARYRDAVVRWLGRRGVQPADAEDVLQDLLLRLFEKLHQYDRARGPFRPWLRGVLYRTLVEHVRGRDKVPGGTGRGGDFGESWLTTLTADDALDALVGELDPVEHAENAAEWAVIRRLISPNDLACYLAVECHGRAYDDVAADLGKPRHAVHQAVFRTRKRIRTYRAGRTTDEE